MSIELENGYHHIKGEELHSPSLTIWVKDGKIKSVNVHSKGCVDLETLLITPQNIKTKTSTKKHTVRHEWGDVSKIKSVRLTHEEVA